MGTLAHPPSCHRRVAADKGGALCLGSATRCRRSTVPNSSVRPTRPKAALLGESLALLFPIGWPEPFGSCDTPVIAFDRGAV
jgi:hypothetical protein